MQRGTPIDDGDTGEWFLDIVRPSAAATTTTTLETLRPAPPPTVASPYPVQRAATAVMAAGPPPPPAPAQEQEGAAPDSVPVPVSDPTDPIGLDLFDPSPITPESEHGLEDWTPTELSRTYHSARMFRWPTVLGGAIAVLLAVFAVVWASGQPGRAAAARAEAYTAASGDLEASLPGLEASIELIVDRDGLSTAGPFIVEFSNAADGASKLAAEALPATLPLADRSAVDALEQQRQALAVAGGLGSGLSLDVTRLHDYVRAQREVLVLPDLPVAAEAPDINRLSVELAAALADTVGVLGDLPAIGELEAHRVQLDLLVGRFADWQVEYLEALRTGDAAAAQVLLEELTERRTEVDSVLVDPLADLGASLLARAGALSSTLDSMR